MPLLGNPYPIPELLRVIYHVIAGPPRRDKGQESLSHRHILRPDIEVVTWLGFVGDIMPLMGREARFDSQVISFFADCDTVCGNFEGVITKKFWYPYLQKHRPTVFDVLAQVAPRERWILGVANNHAADFGEVDFYRTIQFIEAAGIRWVGSVERPRIELMPQVTLTAWTEWTNKEAPMIPLADPGAPETPGLRIASPHWGYEYERMPRPDQRLRLPSGYHLIIGHHSHLPQPVEIQSSGQIVAWSLGNFVTGIGIRAMGEGAIFKVGLGYAGDGLFTVARYAFQEIRLDRQDRKYCRVSFAWQ